uniref:Uncharacterized protein n=1 Tax=Oryzias melastigma TaxID=30732 RepID=A0A3B3D850_ORYME
MIPPLNAAVPTMPGGLSGYEGMGSGVQNCLYLCHRSIPSLTEDEAREALESFVSDNCCYGSDPVKEGVITNMEPCNTFRYRLETFTEYRSSEQARKPHEGEVADFYTQPAPQPWEVQATPTKFFTDEKKEIRVPFTSTVQVVKLTSFKLHQRAVQYLLTHSFIPPVRRGGCGQSCDHLPVHRCGSCSGTGQKKCELCDGKCRLLSYIKLKVEWTNHVDNLVVQDQSGLKSDCLQSVSGKELFKNSGFMAYPLLGFPNPAISDASERLTREHQSKYAQNSRILQQRQTVELIPVTKVNYKWKDHAYSFIVYGSERKVQADDYPDSCVCCVIL